MAHGIDNGFYPEEFSKCLPRHGHRIQWVKHSAWNVIAAA